MALVQGLRACGAQEKSSYKTWEHRTSLPTNPALQPRSRPAQLPYLASPVPQNFDSGTACPPGSPAPAGPRGEGSQRREWRASPRGALPWPQSPGAPELPCLKTEVMKQSMCG